MKKWRLFMEWALQVIGMSVVVVLGMTVLTGGQIWLGFSKASGGRMVSDLPVKMMLVTVFVSAVTSSGVYTSYIPAGMCLNCRRKDALMGMQIMKLVVALLMSAITLLLAAVGDWQFVRGNTAEALEILRSAPCDIRGRSRGARLSAVPEDRNDNHGFLFRHRRRRPGSNCSHEY